MLPAGGPKASDVRNACRRHDERMPFPKRLQGVSSVLRCSFGVSVQFSNGIELPLKRQLIERVKTQAREDLDSRVEFSERPREHPFLILFGALGSRRIFDSPMRRHRLPRPDGAHLLCSSVTHGEDEVEPGRIRCRKLVPALAAKTLRREVIPLEYSGQCVTDDPPTAARCPRPRGRSSPSAVTHRADRIAVTTRATRPANQLHFRQAVMIIQMEYVEMTELRLTLAQAARLVRWRAFAANRSTQPTRSCGSRGHSTI